MLSVAKHARHSCGENGKVACDNAAANRLSRLGYESTDGSVYPLG
jgi:hypothetical protein